jgi:phosphate-selective porin OprO and OprP
MSRIAGRVVIGLVSIVLPAHGSPEPNAGRIPAIENQAREVSGQVMSPGQQNAAHHSGSHDSQSGPVRVSIKNGRPDFASADGDFRLSIRALVQYDTAYYSQGRMPVGVDFSSGNNVRRALLGLEGSLFKDWSYKLAYELGGSGVESSRLNTAYLQFDALAPVHLRIGVYKPPENFDDSTSSRELLFLERAQPANLARGIAGSSGRDAVTTFAYGDRYFVAASYTGGVAGESAVFDEQQAFVGRIAYRVLRQGESNFVVGADTTYVFHLADKEVGAEPAHIIRLRERPELSVDSQNARLIDTGDMDASKVWEWGAEAAANWSNLYAQGGYFGYRVTRRSMSDALFNGWYAQASWVLTGESKHYRADRAAYSAPTPLEPFSLERGGWGAWELAARYSDLDLDHNAGVAGSVVPIDGIRGGNQRIWTVGFNWYPNNSLRFILDIQHTAVTRLSIAGGSLNAMLDSVSLRTQFSI